MPCSDGYPPRDHGIYNSSEVESLRQRLDRVTDLLCQAGRAARYNHPMPAAVKEWWEDHCRSDERAGRPW